MNGLGTALLGLLIMILLPLGFIKLIEIIIWIKRRLWGRYFPQKDINQMTTKELKRGILIRTLKRTTPRSSTKQISDEELKRRIREARKKRRERRE